MSYSVIDGLVNFARAFVVCYFLLAYLTRSNSETLGWLDMSQRKMSNIAENIRGLQQPTQCTRDEYTHVLYHRRTGVQPCVNGDTSFQWEVL